MRFHDSALGDDERDVERMGGGIYEYIQNRCQFKYVEDTSTANLKVVHGSKNLNMKKRFVSFLSRPGIPRCASMKNRSPEVASLSKCGVFDNIVGL